MNFSKLTAYGVVLVIALLLLSSFPKWTADDAFILFRYAQNAVEHGQLTFNAGEDPVEGYTGILLTLTLTAAILLGLSPVFTSHAVGVVSFAVCLAVIIRLLDHLRIRFWQRLSTLFCFVTAAFFYTHVFSAMETALFSALLLLGFYRFFLLITQHSKSLWSYSITASTLLLLSLCRPEGALFAVLVTLVTAGHAIITRSMRHYLPAFAVFLLLPGLIYFIWRWRYYGFPMPNTFYAKLNPGFTAESIDSLGAFLRQYLLLPAIIAALPYISSIDESATWIARHKSDKKPFIIVTSTLLFFITVVLLHYGRSDLEMNFSYRFYAPFYPLLLFLLNMIFAPGVETILHHRKARPLCFYAVFMIAFLLLYVQIAKQTKWFFTHEKPIARAYQTGLQEMHISAGKYLNQRLPHSQWIAVYKDAGAIPYFSRHKTIDFGALNNEYLAHHPRLTISQRLDYLFSKKPGALVITSYAADSLYYNKETDRLLQRPEMQQYKLAKKYINSGGRQYFQFLYLRRDIGTGIHD